MDCSIVLRLKKSRVEARLCLVSTDHFDDLISYQECYFIRLTSRWAFWDCVLPEGRDWACARNQSETDRN